MTVEVPVKVDKYFTENLRRQSLSCNAGLYRCSGIKLGIHDLRIYIDPVFQEGAHVS